MLKMFRSGAARFGCAAAVTLGCLLACSARAAVVVFSADTEGHVGPCQDCPLHAGMGGLARRATSVAALRQSNQATGVVLADAGNFLFGPDSMGSDGRVIVAAYDSLGYDAVNLSYRDFRLGKDATLTALKDAKFATVSANLLDAAGGAPLVKPYVVKQAGSRRVALLGLTEAPAGLNVLPHLKRQLNGIRIADPAEALRQWGPKARAESDDVVVLYYGSAASLAKVLPAAEGVKTLIVAGARPEQLPPPRAVALSATSEHGKHLGAVDLATAKVAQVALDESVKADPAMEQLVAANSGKVSARIEAMAQAGVKSQAAPAAPAVGAPPQASSVPAAGAAASADPLTPGKARRLGTVTGNRGAKVSVASAEVMPAYGAAKAREGRQLLVLATEWENVIPLTLIEKKQVPTEYKIPNLADHVYVVVNGNRVGRLVPTAAELAGHVPVKDFSLAAVGSTARGNLVFDVPADGLGSVELRFYDYAHGHFAVPIAGGPAAAAADVKPVSPALKNEVLEVAAFGLSKSETLGTTAAPPGMVFVTADLRARSTFTVEADATAFDAKARPGQKTKVGHVADWKESRRYLQLVADGEYAYMPEPQTELEEEPRFLPDVMTGGRVVFLAPADATSLELRCDFPNAKASTGGAVFRPKGMTLALEGKRPARTDPTAIARVDDAEYRVQVMGQQTAAEFAGKAAAEGKKFLVLDFTVFNNGGRNGEFFQTPQQLKYAAETGEQVALSPVTYQGPRRPAELVWIPPGERRSFQVAFEIGAAETRPRLAFTGVSKAQVLNLKQIEATAVAATPRTDGANTAPAAEPAKQPAKTPPAVAANDPAKMPAKAPAQVTTPAVKDPAPPAPQPAAPGQNIKPIRVAAKQPHAPKGLAGVGLTPEQVNAAIDRGAEALWKHQSAELKKNRGTFGYNLGYDALVALALVHSNYHKKSPEFDAELRGMLNRIDPPDMGTYGAGVLSMLIEAYGDGMYLPKMKQTVRCIVESQGIEGSWGYTAKAPEALLRDPVADKVLQIRGGVPLEGEGSLGAVLERKSEFKAELDGDNSTTQYAMLGLWSAARSKVRVDPEAWTRALKVTRDRQTDDGGWQYHHKGAYGYGSMTCAGICSVALARHHLGEAAPAEDPSVERGLAWLVNNFSVTKHPEGSDNHFYYYLYSLERVGRVLDTEFIGPHEWYPLGARHLIDQQQPDGNWKGFGDEERPVLASSFALLFLTRATATLNVEQKRGGDGKLRTDVAVAPGHRVYIILDCSGSMLPEIDGKQKFEIARDSVSALVESLPDNAEVALRAYGHRKNARQEGADEDTELLLPMGKLDRKAFAAKLAPLKARGKTPLALSLKQAAGDLSGYARDKDKPVTVVLLTDGGEDTRGRQDPVASAAELAKLPGLNLQVVGFDINRPDWTQQLQGIARGGGGQYLTAAKADTLLRELKSAVFRVPDTFVVTTAKGQPVMQAPFGTEKTLPEGQYQFTASFGGRKYSEPFWINTDATTAVVFDASKVGANQGTPATAGADAAPVDGVPPTAQTPAGAKKKFCTNCGAPLTATAKFCTKCGTKAGG